MRSPETVSGRDQASSAARISAMKRPAARGASASLDGSSNCTSALPITTASATSATARAVLRVADAEAHADRQLHVRPDARNHLLHTLDVEVARARHALERHMVDIAAGHAGDVGDAFCRRRGRDQEDGIEPARAQQGGERGALLGRIVDHEHAVDAGSLCVVGEAFHAVTLDRICITHQHHRRRRVARAELAHDGQHLRHADASRQRALAGLLDHRTVGHRVAERNAELDDVGARRGHRLHDCRGFPTHADRQR